MMPWDVSTRWNSTYDTLQFALVFQDALDTIVTSDKEMKLWKKMRWMKKNGRLCSS
jgi:hypothetical protein